MNNNKTNMPILLIYVFVAIRSFDFLRVILGNWEVSKVDFITDILLFLIVCLALNFISMKTQNNGNNN